MSRQRRLQADPAALALIRRRRRSRNDRIPPPFWRPGPFPTKEIILAAWLWVVWLRRLDAILAAALSSTFEFATARLFAWIVQEPAPLDYPIFATF